MRIMRCWNHKVENFYKDLKKTSYKSRVWLGTERPSTFTFHPRLMFVLRSHNSMPIRCWHKVRNFYKETGKLSRRLFDLRWSFLTTFTRARIHNMWQECKNVAKIFQREGATTCGWISDEMEVSRHLTLNSSAINNPSLVHSSRSVQHSKTVQFLK